VGAGVGVCEREKEGIKTVELIDLGKGGVKLCGLEGVIKCWFPFTFHHARCRSVAIVRGLFRIFLWQSKSCEQHKLPEEEEEEEGANRTALK
jgi:hypothetical protein